jgi:TPP-dependent 2-oxoacid decarboxylase
VSLLPRPFHYPYPIVSIVFEEEFLETPFTTMLGINKGSKWLESNEAVFMEKMEGKIVLNLNDDEVKIKSRRKYKLPKS